MFQRLKGAIDSRIAEEQARQRQAQLSAQGRSPARPRRPQTNNATPQRPASRVRDGSSAQGEKQPDPADFVIGEDEGSSTPAVEKPDPLAKANEGEAPQNESASEKQSEQVAGSEDNAEIKASDTNGTAVVSEQPPELSVEVRAKLRKLEKLESKYGELLRAYRAAHSRVQMIEPFEASLRENTPLTSISDPSALVEYLNQLKIKSDMVLEEFKRVSSDRDDFKKKFEQSEKEKGGLKEEVEELNKKANTMTEQKPQSESDKTFQNVVDANIGERKEKSSDDADAATRSPPPSRLGSLSIFSPKFGASKEHTRETSEDLFSYDSEVPRLEQELQERTAEVADLNKQVGSLKADLKVARDSTSSMVESLETATRDLNSLRDEKEKFEVSKSELEKRITELEATVKADSTKNEFLHRQISELEDQNTEAATEIQKLKAKIDEIQAAKSELEKKLEAEAKNMEIINEKLSQKDHVVKDLEDSLALARAAERESAKKAESDKSSEKKLATMQGIMENLRSQLSSADAKVAELKEDIKAKQDEFASKPSSKVFGFLNERDDPKLKSIKSQQDVVDYLAESYGLQKSISTPTTNPSTAMSATQASLEAPNNSTGGKKKNKKKKKGGKGTQSTTDEAEPDMPVKVSEDLNDMGDDTPPTTAPVNASVTALEHEILELKNEMEAKMANIETLSKRIKDQEALQEEIETLRDDLLHQGQEHVEARDALKDAQEARKKLQESIESLESELKNAQKQISAHADSEKSHKETSVQLEEYKTKFADSEKAHGNLNSQLEELKVKHTDSEQAQSLLNTQLEELKTKSTAMEKDLSVAENLATSRFKEITDLKEVLSKAQPELQKLRSEVSELRTAKDDLKNKDGDLKRLESRHEDLKSEMKGLSKRLGDKDSEIKQLQAKIEQETKARNKVENNLASAQLDARVAENKRKDTSELLEQRQKDLTQSKEEAANLRKKITELEDKVSSHSNEITALKEEVSLKTALHSSSQSLLQSLRDQTHELSMQARESSSRAESLEEELTEAQRMLSERTRESQTMRTLLDQAQTGVEARIREMKERMEAAIEERDRVEDEANVRDRRLMRDVEDAKNKMRDAQKQLKGLEDERDELETKNRDWRRRREELEQQAQEAKKDSEDIKQAMKGLRDALDESERQVREVETQKSELRRQVDETNERIEKLTRANKNLSEELKKLQEGGSRRPTLRPAGTTDSGIRSSRTSIDSTRSPAPPLAQETSTSRSETPTGANRTGSNVGLSQGTVDYVYLKNVLLQFMEQKDKTHQRQLVPVLGMLLHFDRKDEQKWMAAITSR